MTELQNNRITELQINRRTDRANQVYPPLFQSGAIINGYVIKTSRSREVKQFACSITAQTNVFVRIYM